MVASILYVIVGIIEALIGLRFAFLLLGANPTNDFVHMIYQWSTPFVAPFANMFGQNATVTGDGFVTRSVFDWTALIALVVYGLIAVIIGHFAGTRRHTYGV